MEFSLHNPKAYVTKYRLLTIVSILGNLSINSLKKKWGANFNSITEKKAVCVDIHPQTNVCVICRGNNIKVMSEEYLLIDLIMNLINSMSCLVYSDS